MTTPARPPRRGVSKTTPTGPGRADDQGHGYARHLPSSGTVAKRFHTVQEVADLLGVSTPTIYREIRAGRFPAIRLRGRYVIPAKALDQLEQAALAQGAAVDPAERGWA